MINELYIVFMYENLSVVNKMTSDTGKRSFVSYLYENAVGVVNGMLY